MIQQGVDNSLFHVGDRDVARGRLGITTHSPVLLWVGRMVPVKGLDVLLNACASLRDRGREFRLCLIGDGPLRNDLGQQARALGLAEIVDFVGSRRPAELPDYYHSADMVVLPSHSEGIPNVLREALSVRASVCRQQCRRNRRNWPAAMPAGCARIGSRTGRRYQCRAQTSITTPDAISLRAPNPSWDETAQQVTRHSRIRRLLSWRHSRVPLSSRRLEAPFSPRRAHS